jgi:signal transduction histidine kinase
MSAKAKILIVDDNAMNREIIEEMLEDQYELASVASGEEALAISRDFRPDLVLLDIMMPGIDGYETCRRLRSDTELYYVKVILVSAKSLTQDRLDGYAAGADDYITKPFDADELEAKVKVFLRLKRAEELDQLKSDVLSLLNHETRTPLNTIHSSLDILAGDAAMDPEQRKGFIDIARTSCDRLSSLLTKSMLLSEFRAKNVDLHISQFSADTLIKESINSIRERRAGSQVQIQITGMTDKPVMGDKNYLRMVVEALLDNALRHSPNGEEVTVKVDSSEGKTQLTVIDRGPGIADSQQSDIFSVFPANDIDHHNEGHGLSLALSKEIVELHGGLLEFESEPHRETRFRMSVPATRNDAVARPAGQPADLLRLR